MTSALTVGALSLRRALSRRPFAWLLDVALATALVAAAGWILFSLAALGQLGHGLAPSNARAQDPNLFAPAAGAPGNAGATPPGPIASGGRSVRPEATLFVTFGTPSADTQALQARLAAIDAVATVRFLGRDDALAMLSTRADSAAAGVVAALKSNPLPDAYLVRFEAAAPPDRIEAALTALRRLPRVDSVDFDMQAWRKAYHLEALLRGVGGAALAIGTLLVAGLAFRLGSAGLPVAPGEVQALRVVGATPSQIVQPVALLGALGCAAAGAAGMGIALIANAVAGPRLATLAELYGAAWRWPLPSSWLAAVTVVVIALGSLVGLGLGALSGWWAVRRIEAP
jgi:cell division protein FtsX